MRLPMRSASSAAACNECGAMPASGCLNIVSPAMENKTRQDDDLLMSLVEQALAQPEGQRHAYLESACAGDRELLEQARNYVRWDERMQGFLLEPLVSPPAKDAQEDTGTLVMTPADGPAGAE